MKILRIKICGLTRAADALLACELGADAIGFIFYDRSPRTITPAAAAAIAQQLPPHVARVGVFVNTPVTEIRRFMHEIPLNVLQFHGPYALNDLAQFEASQVVAVARVGDEFEVATLTPYRSHAAAILLDTQKTDRYGGTGETFNWQIAKHATAAGRIILAGGLTPENVVQAVDTVAPYALDVSSGVESSPGQKDHAKLRQLFRQLASYRTAWQPETPCPFPHS